ncbi:hypothetical protein ACRRTK_025008 [Alexandromys fortis]
MPFFCPKCSKGENTALPSPCPGVSSPVSPERALPSPCPGASSPFIPFFLPPGFQELLHYVIGTLLLLIASIVAASKSYNQSGLVAGAIFGFLASFLCLASLWLSYKITCITQSTGHHLWSPQKGLQDVGSPQEDPRHGYGLLR